MADHRSVLGATRLLGLQLTPGKLRGLQRISNPNGTLTMVATDQNNSMANMIKESLKKKNQEREPTYEEMVEAKVHLARVLGQHCSGLLVDAYYGAWNSVASFAIPPATGILIRVEKSSPGKNKRGAPIGEIEGGWSVGKIKSFGADAVKLLAQYEPTEFDSAERQFAFVQYIAEECRKHDILFVLETIAFPFDGEKKDSPTFLARKAETVIESARQLSRFCDIYKAEFPGHLKDGEATCLENLRKLDAACERPWVLLSAGVDFPEYKKQVELAVKSGASGVLGGRAFWKEYFLQPDFQARDQFLRNECVHRVQTIDGIVREQARPWFARYGLTLQDLHAIRTAEGWHLRYAAQSVRSGVSTLGGEGAY